MKSYCDVVLLDIKNYIWVFFRIVYSRDCLRILLRSGGWLKYCERAKIYNPLWNVFKGKWSFTSKPWQFRGKTKTFAKIFVRISQTYCRISHFFAKINKATLRKNCFCEILRKVIFQKKHKNHSCRKYISREIFAKRFSLETQVVTLIKVCLEK